MLHEAMRPERVATAEVEQAARENGVARLEELEAMILEADGTFSVVAAVPSRFER